MARNRRKTRVGKVQVSIAPRGTRIGDVLFDVHKDLQHLLVVGGLSLMQALFEDDIAQLCGERYERTTDDDNVADRWGSQPGVVVMGGQKISIKKPRVRRNGKEVVLPSYEAFQREDPLNKRALEQMVIGVSTRKYARSLESPEPMLDRHNVSRSSVSRKFVAMSSAQLEKAMSAMLSDREWAVLMIDGIAFADHVVVIVLGIDSTGKKHILGLREGSTENATLCRELLSDVVARGVPADKSILVVIDGGKGLRKAVTQVFDFYAMVHRCQVHKRRNVIDQLPDDKRAHVQHVMEQAYAAGTSAVSAAKQLKNLVRVLELEHPGAAGSLKEGLEETLTIKALNLPELLQRSLASTNAIENLNGTIRHVSKRVKHWRGGKMILRWVATGIFEASRGFRRLRGSKSMLILMTALRERDKIISGDKLCAVG